MSELAFAKVFLSALDSRPVKLRADYVLDQEHVAARVPYLLPRLQPPHPEMPKKIRPTIAPGSSKSVTVHLKSARHPSLEVKLSNAPLSTTSVSDLKDAIRERVADSQDNKVPLDKIKILYKRKPIAGNKTVAEILADEPELLAGGKEVEFGVMIMGGAKVVAPSEEEAVGESQETGVSTSSAAVGLSGEAVLETVQFWDDLQGFLEQRIKDKTEAQKLRELFKDAWVTRR